MKAHITIQPSSASSPADTSGIVRLSVPNGEYRSVAAARIATAAIDISPKPQAATTIAVTIMNTTDPHQVLELDLRKSPVNPAAATKISNRSPAIKAPMARPSGK